MPKVKVWNNFIFHHLMFSDDSGALMGLYSLFILLLRKFYEPSSFSVLHRLFWVLIFPQHTNTFAGFFFFFKITLVKIVKHLISVEVKILFYRFILLISEITKHDDERAFEIWLPCIYYHFGSNKLLLKKKKTQRHKMKQNLWRQYLP